MDRLKHAVGAAACFLFGGGRKDRDVDGAGSGAVDLLAQASLVGRRDRKLGSRVDVDRIRVQGGNRPVDDRPGLRSGHEDERRRRGREQERGVSPI